MTDQELIKFLRTSTSAVFNKTTAHRIEELERKNAEMNLLYGEVKDGLEAKLAECEARLSKAVEALRVISQFNAVTNNHLNVYNIFKMTDRARAALAELEGEDHG